MVQHAEPRSDVADGTSSHGHVVGGAYRSCIHSRHMQHTPRTASPQRLDQAVKTTRRNGRDIQGGRILVTHLDD